MDLTDAALDASWRIAGWLVTVPLVAFAAWRSDWSRAGENEPVHVFLATLAALVALWSLRGAVHAGLAFHLLGTAGLALATGPARALVGGAALVVAVALLRGAGLGNAAWVWLTLVAIPVATVTAVLRATQRWLPPNFFVYVFVVAFFGAALAHAAGGVAATLVATLAGAGAGPVADDVPVLLVLAFGEATLTGMLVTLAVVYRPAWVATFDDRRYLAPPR
jgi:uncharacterized membrane protein